MNAPSGGKVMTCMHTWVDRAAMQGATIPSEGAGAGAGPQARSAGQELQADAWGLDTCTWLLRAHSHSAGSPPRCQ